MTPSRPAARDPLYAPHRRTGLLLTGTGTAGAYHAGVLRALDEAGVKIDLIAGCGMGVVNALYAAIDGGARLWEQGGIWRHPYAGRLYAWRPALKIAGFALATALAGVVVPALVLVLAAAVYPMAFFLGLLGFDAGSSMGMWQARVLEIAFAENALPDVVPRVVVLCLTVLAAALAISAVVASFRRAERRRRRGPILWSLLGSVFETRRTDAWFVQELWNLIKGAAPIVRPADADLASRYADLLAENLGEPRFRELIVTAHDIDARCDLIFALLGEPHRCHFLQQSTERDALGILDLSGAARVHVLDAVGGALSLPVATEPHHIVFAPESAWRGETHRLCARPDAVGRLLEEMAAAGVEQVIVVTSTTTLGGPHALDAGRRDVRGRAGEYLAAIEAAAVRDAIAAHGATFAGLFVIRPSHNPVGPLDFRGVYDRRSDRRQSLAELIERGYEDAYHQFVDQVVGASGEKIDAVPRRGAS